MLQKDLEDLDKDCSYLLSSLENIKNTVLEEPYSPTKIYKAALSYCSNISRFELTLPSISLKNNTTEEWIRHNLGLNMEYYSDKEYTCE
ncbi:MAG: hypothetical protein K6E76_04720 [Patescibacteria group bacterium]|nr:hypothetical protein [Patescibacteria group bacterium]